MAFTSLTFRSLPPSCLPPLLWSWRWSHQWSVKQGHRHIMGLMIKFALVLSGLLAAGARASDADCTNGVQTCQIQAMDLNQDLMGVSMVIGGAQAPGTAVYNLCAKAPSVQSCFTALGTGSGACVGFSTNAAYVAATSSAPGMFNYATAGACDQPKQPPTLLLARPAPFTGQ